MYHHSVQSCSWPFGGVVHNSSRVARISVRLAVCCFKAMISSDWVLDTDLELPTVKPLQAARKFSTVVLESPCTWFLLGPPPSTNPDRNPDGSKDRPHISPSTGYYRSPENEKRNHHIQFNKNNNLQNKMVEQTYHKVLSAVVNELLHPFWRSWLRMCISTNSSIGLDSRPRDVACKEKKLIK
jgi:hypothetical protein